MQAVYVIEKGAHRWPEYCRCEIRVHNVQGGRMRILLEEPLSGSVQILEVLHNT